MFRNISISIVSLFLFVFLVTPTQVVAQYFPFGKNRVQYEDFDWRFIESQHFDIYYYSAKNYELAEFAAKSLESAYKQLKEDFNHDISARIPLIVYDSHNDFSQTNVVALPVNAEGIGGVTDKFKNRMTVPFGGDYHEFRRVLHHELVHAVFNDMFYGGTVTSIIRNNIQLVFPLWFEEGLAEYTALGWDSNTDMFIRDATINNYLPDIQFLGGYFAYRGGQSLWNYIVEEYGRRKIAEILSIIKTTRNVEQGFIQALGLNIEELSDQWQEALKKRYYPEVAERERADVIASLLTERGRYGSYNTSPAISPRGDKIAFITNSRGYFDVVVMSAIDGSKLKTLIKGEDNPEFEELNILNPNLSWSPDGSHIAISSKTKGRDDLALVNYQTGAIKKIKFSTIDAIASVAWSPDGNKIAFAGNIGPYQDIFVYDLSSEKLTNLTQDFFTDVQPSWSSDSKNIIFTSYRGDKTQLKTYNTGYNLLDDLSIYQSDLYMVSLDGNKASRLTNTDNINEFSPQTTRDNKMVFISDKNGIQNIYTYDLDIRTSKPITNLQTGISQISISSDGSRLAFNSINEGYLDIFLLRSPLNRTLSSEPSLNYWAQRRLSESEQQRVPAIMYAKEMFANGIKNSEKPSTIQESLDQKQKEEEKGEKADIDFRNYVFDSEVISDTSLILEDIDSFQPEDNITEDGRFQPREYRLKFSTDIAYNPSITASTYGSNALTQFIVSDLLGDHQISMGTNFVLDLRNSDYSLQYGYLKNRTNFYASYFHTSRRYQTFFGEIIRFRTYGGAVNLQYPINKFKRVDAGLSVIGVTRDYSSVTERFRGLSFGNAQLQNERSVFAYPEIIFTNDKTLPGFLTPRGGNRYSVGLSGSPGLGDNAPKFISMLGDFRKYFNLGYNYSFALRASGATSYGRDAQIYFLGGRLGWINQQFSDNGLSFDRLTDNFFTVPALPVRGYAYNSIYGNHFGLINAEFRFPLFAAVIPGAIPILPLYNITGVAFFDVGTAWGERIEYGLQDEQGNPIINGSGLDFTVAKERLGFFQGQVQDGSVQQFAANYLDGDILIGAGFGLRTIVFGLPLRYDVGWPYDRTGFKSKPIHYFSIGIDF